MECVEKSCLECPTRLQGKPKCGAKKIVFRSKKDCEHLLGQFLDESHYDTLVDYACDIHYAPIDGIPTEENVVAVYRPNFFDQKEMDGAFDGLFSAAGASQNRGIAAGPRGGTLGKRHWVTAYQTEILKTLLKVDTDSIDGSDPIDEIRDRFAKLDSKDDARGSVWLIEKIPENFKFDDWVDSIRDLPYKERQEAAKEVESWISVTSYANEVYSGIAGAFGRYPRIPFGRLSSFTRDNYDTYKRSFPFLNTLARAFEQFLPERYSNQKKFVEKIDENFIVPGTPFTTITVNRTFRTAAHRDAGDLDSGFSNLCVLSNGKEYRGGYLILPELEAAVAVKPGDLLLIGNHDWIHGNTPIEKVDPEAERISLVCYAREDMAKLGEFEYESLREQFVNFRRKNPDHPLQRKRWNGISPNCFSDSSDPKQDWEAARDWYEFLKEKGERYLDKYHPWLKDHFENDVSLDDFFA